MKRGRKPIDVTCPKGFPFRLYDANGKFVVATSKEDVRKLAKSKNIKLANITNLVAANGHSGTNVILKQFGERWVCKEGHIFFAQ